MITLVEVLIKYEDTKVVEFEDEQNHCGAIIMVRQPIFLKIDPTQGDPSTTTIEPFPMLQKVVPTYWRSRGLKSNRGMQIWSILMPYLLGTTGSPN